MEIAVFAYRSWALDICRDLINCFDFQYRSRMYTVNLYKSKEDIKYLKETSPDVCLFLGWSWIVPKEIVESKECLCLHPSDLLSYRGGTPLQHQIMDGIKETKLTLFRMTSEIDWGLIYDQCSLSLEGDIQDIYQRMHASGSEMIMRLLESWDSRTYWAPDLSERQPALKRRTPEQSEITIEELRTLTAEQLYNKIRCLTDPYPNAFLVLQGKRVYITGAKI